MAQRNYAPMARGAYELARAFAMAPAVERRASRAAMQDALDGALAQARIDKYRTDAELGRQRLAGMEEGRNRFLAGATGLTQPQLDELNRAMNEGWLRQAEGPPTPAGEYPVMDGRPDWATPEVEDRFRQANLALGANLIGTGKTNANQLVAALQGALNLGLQRKLLDGKAQPEAVARVMGAMAGKPTVDVTGSGIAFDPYGNKTDLNVEPFMAKAQAAGGAGGSGAGGGARLPNTARMIEYYQRLGYPQEEAVRLANTAKRQPVSNLLMNAYMQAAETVNMMPPPEGIEMGSPEYQAWRERMIETIARRAYEFSQRFGSPEASAMPGTGPSDPADPLGLRR